MFRAVLMSSIALAAFAQTAAGPQFDVASVKVVDKSSLGRGGRLQASGGPGTNDPERFSDPVATMVGLLIKAYGVDTGQIIGPPWFFNGSGDFYRLTATMPPDTTKEQFQLMLQNLLKDRFHLAAHHETRPFPAYELVIDKGGAKLKEAVSQPDDGPVSSGPRTTVSYAGVGKVEMKEQTADYLAERLGLALWGDQLIETQNLNLPKPRVVNKTGLTGKYTFTIEYSRPGPPGFTPQPDTPATLLPNLLVSLREQLGLRLNKTEGVPVDVIVVDSVDKVPTEN